MSTSAARVGKVKVCATDGSYVDLQVESIDASGWAKTEPMDTTIMGDTASRSAASGFSKATLKVSGPYDAADAGMVILEANLASCYVEYLPLGSTGYKSVMCIDFKKSGKAGSDAMKYDASFAICNGVAPTTV